MQYDQISSSLWRPFNFVFLSISLSICTRYLERHLSSDIPVACFLLVCTRGSLDVSLKIPIFHVAFSSMRYFISPHVVSFMSFKMYAIPWKDSVNEEDRCVGGFYTGLAFKQAFRSRFETRSWGQMSLVTSGGDGWCVKMEDGVTVIAPIIT